MDFCQQVIIYLNIMASSEKGAEDDLNLSDSIACPVCSRQFEQGLIQEHVNKCLFLNTEPVAEQSQLKRSGTHLQKPFSEEKRIKLGPTSSSTSAKDKVRL